MKVLIFDTEGNGNREEQICQLSYLIVESGEITGKNFYFCVDSMNSHAQDVHGLSKYALHEMSSGHKFKDDCEEILRDFESADLVVGHHVTSDISRMKKELVRLGKNLKLKKTFCTMRYFNNALHLTSRTGQRKFPRLDELCKYYSVSPDYVRLSCGCVYAAEDVSEHDARYDAMATYLVMAAASRSGDVRGVF